MPVQLQYEAKSPFQTSRSSAKKDLLKLLAGSSEVTVSVGNADPALVLFSIVAAATSRLSGEQRAALVGGLGGASVKGATVFKNGITVDLSTGTITRGFYVQQATIASCFGCLEKMTS